MAVQCQVIFWTNVGILLTEPRGTRFSEIAIEIRIFSFMKMRLKISSAKWRPLCLGLIVADHWQPCTTPFLVVVRQNMTDMQTTIESHFLDGKHSQFLVSIKHDKCAWLTVHRLSLVYCSQYCWNIFNISAIQAWTKWPPNARRHFQIHFDERKILYFDSIRNEVCS